MHVAIERARDWWYKQDSAQRTRAVRTIFLLGVLLVLLGAYLINKGDKPERKAPPPPPKKLIVTDSVLDADLDARIALAVASAMKEQLIEKANQAAPPVIPVEEECPEEDDLCLDGIPEVTPEALPSPVQTYPSSPYPNGTPAAGNTPPQVPPQPKFIGDIDTQQVYAAPAEQTSATDAGTEPTTITIPVGFMPAKLLVGVQASVSNGASGAPKPVHLIVKAPATMPNRLKMNLEGCFVIANTWGNLAAERIEAELVSMSCITQDQKTLINGAMKGYVADTDGQRDMAGIVVSRADSLLQLKILADVLGGVGSSVAEGTGEQTVSALGSVNVRDSGDHLNAGLAKGVSSGFSGAGDYIGDLIVQSGPVIEKGPAADVMLMIQETATLQIRRI